MEINKQTMEQAREAVDNAFPEIFSKENVLDILDSIEVEEKDEEEEDDDKDEFSSSRNKSFVSAGKLNKKKGKKSNVLETVLDQLDYAEKEELKDEMKEELKEELRSEMKEELLDEMKGELVDKVKEAISNLLIDDYINKKEVAFSVDEHNKITLDNIGFNEKEMAKAIVEGIDFN